MISTPHFTFSDGLTHGLVGPNGIGKTTLLRKIAGQLNGSGIKVDGDKPYDNEEVLGKIVLMGIDNPLPEGWNLKKVFTVSSLRWPTWNKERAEELVKRFELPMKNYSGLSRGQKSAASFIVAVASGVPYMLLDEPYLGLDASKREVFYEVLREEHGRTIIVSTHHLNELSGLLDTVALMGENPLSGPIDEFIEGVVQLTGSTEALDRALGRLQLPVLQRETSTVADRALVDARPNHTANVFAMAQEIGLRVTEVSLEQAVLALGEAR
ncbi:MAG TPA: ATP-binding cassette domain-containing protein [Candidatus Corynebacterium faecipullorum]|nr:ATP-binding cassette domain-containing protein [Candidatus Corynebacterium faecipullorum]